MRETTGRELVDALAALIGAGKAAAPTLVAIDGKPCAGKTTLADNVAAALRAAGSEVYRASIDDFLPAGYLTRARAGAFTPAQFLDEGFDYDALIAMVLRPARGAPPRRVQLRFRNVEADELYPAEPVELSDRSILVVDGILLLRPELRGFWDLSVRLEIDHQTMIERATKREIPRGASVAAIVEWYGTLLGEVLELYERRYQPAAGSTVVIDNRDAGKPRIVRWPDGAG